MKTNDSTMNEKAKFLRYQHGVAYYGLSIPYCETLFSFPVPLHDIEDGVLQAEDKIVNFMKYIRKAIQDGTLNKECE